MNHAIIDIEARVDRRSQEPIWQGRCKCGFTGAAYRVNFDDPADDSHNQARMDIKRHVTFKNGNEANPCFSLTRHVRLTRGPFEPLNRNHRYCSATVARQAQPSATSASRV